MNKHVLALAWAAVVLASCGKKEAQAAPALAPTR